MMQSQIQTDNNMFTTPVSRVSRVQICSNCRITGHNALTCDRENLLDFEARCAYECQSMEKQEFINWIKHNYKNNLGLLKHFVDINVDISTIMYNDISFYAYEIAEYIYNKYVTSAPIINNMSPRNLYYEYNETYYNNNTNYIINPIQPIEPSIDQELLHDSSGEYSINELIDLLYESVDDTHNNNGNNRVNIQCVYEELTGSSKEVIVDCCICFESKLREECVTLNCRHEFCKDCTKESLRSDTRPEPLCMICRDKVTLITTRSFEICGEMSQLF